MQELFKKLDSISDGHAMEVVIICAILLLVHIGVTLILTLSAKKKGHSELGYFFLCLVFGIVGYCITASLVDYQMRDLIEAMLAQDSHYNEDIQSPACEMTTAILAQKEDEREPDGIVAYMPSERSCEKTIQEEAADKLKAFWQESKQAKMRKESTKKQPEKAAKNEKNRRNGGKSTPANGQDEPTFDDSFDE